MPAGPPTGYAVFAGDNTIRSVRDAAGAITQWSNCDQGGHFPAMEVPDQLAGDIREFFRPLRRRPQIVRPGYAVTSDMRTWE